MSRYFNSSLAAAQVQGWAHDVLTSTLQLPDHGPKCTVGVILQVLLWAAARISSIAQACAQLAQAPSDQAVYNALAAWLPGMEPLGQRLNQALQARLPKSLLRKARPLVIDLKQIGYYGQPNQPRELRRGKRQAGTSRFHSYATLYVQRRGERFTVALTYVWKDDSYQAVVQRLLEQAHARGLRCRYLLLDRAFYSVAVIQYLQQIHCPFLMPVVHRGRMPKPPKPPEGTRQFLRWKRSGWSTYRLRHKDQSVQFRIAVACRRPPGRGPKGRADKGEKGRPMVFAFWGFRPPRPAWVREHYRLRFGIESSYRQMEQARIRTSSRNVQLRLLLVGLALLLRNLWVWLHRTLWGRVRGRGIEVHLERLRLPALRRLLERWADSPLDAPARWPPPAPAPFALPTGRGRKTWNY